MRTRLRLAIVTAGAAVGLAVLSLAVMPTAGQAPAGYKAPRSPFKDGKPDLNGIWQANNTANWDVQGHAARQGPILELGAAFSVPAGLGVVEGDDIPYQPWAAAKKKENAANWLKLDPEIKCYMPGVPRATYMPYPFQIVQTPTHILMAYEFASASRTIYMNSKDESPADTWMGWSRGRWEGDTLGRRRQRLQRRDVVRSRRAISTAMRCMSSSASHRSAEMCFSTTSRSKIPRCLRVRGR